MSGISNFSKVSPRREGNGARMRTIVGCGYGSDKLEGKVKERTTKQATKIKKVHVTFRLFHSESLPELSDAELESDE